MADASWTSQLCGACRDITYKMLADGFEHSLTFEETVDSGHTCQFCRIMVCTFSKVQVKDWNIPEIHQNYHKWADKLKLLPYVVQISGANDPGFTKQELVPPPKHLRWIRNSARRSPYLNGNFNDGSTIQLSAPRGEQCVYETPIICANSYYTDSVYKDADLLAVHDIEAADSPRNIRFLNDWLRDCIREHSRCRISFGSFTHATDEVHSNEIHQLPSRVVDVGLNTKIVRLFLSAGKTGMYTALSHRWGSKPIFKTYKGNLDRLSRSIDVKELPRTFQDAIETTRQLWIQYLWVDSLCIVQDDKYELACEIGQMGTIFENSSCTLAAIDALDDEAVTDRGLFLPRDDRLEAHMDCAKAKIGVKEPSTGEISSWCYVWEEKIENKARHQIIARPRLIGYQWLLMWSKWQSRGWILQERILSRRIIYYTKHKIAWDCHTCSGEEEMLGYRNEALRHSYTERRLPWESLVAEYTKCKLSYPSDKLLAISGLANRLEARTGMRYFAGIFEDTDSRIGQCLLWRADSDRILTKYSGFHAPSWSWAAYEGAVTFSPQSEGSPAYRSLISDLKFDIQDRCHMLQCPNKNATCKTGSVSFKGLVGTVFLSGCFGSIENRENEALLSVLSSAVYLESIPIPRKVEGKVTVPRRELSLPDRT